MARTWGLSAAALTLAATLSPIANGASRVFWGWASDRLGRENTMVLTFVLQAICLFLVVAVGQTSAAMFSLTLVLVYFTWGQIYSLFPATAGDYFGTRHATSNYAVLYTAKGVASIIGGWFGALLYEQSGSWSMGFYGSAVMALVAAAMAVGLQGVRARAPRSGWPCRRWPSSGGIGRALADEIAAAYAHADADRGRLRPRDGGLDLPTAYAVEAELARRRVAAGHRVVGVKAGYANKAVWRALKLETLAWASMYDDTVAFASGERGHRSPSAG